MTPLKFFEYATNLKVFTEYDEELGLISYKYEKWVFEPNGQAFLTDEELVAILAKLSTLNKNPKVIVIGG